MSAKVCPLLSLTAPLKPLGDYPKCSLDKCAWWVPDKATCFVRVFTAVLAVDSAALSLNSIEMHLRDLSNEINNSYALSQTPVGQAIVMLGRLGLALEQQLPNLTTILDDLSVVLRQLRDQHA